MFARNREAMNFPGLYDDHRTSMISECHAVGDVASAAAPVPEDARALPSDGIPEEPTRDAVSAALIPRGQEAERCSGWQGLSLLVQITFNNSGRVDSVTLSPGESAQYRACLEAAYSRTTVPPFRRTAWSVRFPWPPPADDPER